MEDLYPESSNKTFEENSEGTEYTFNKEDNNGSQGEIVIDQKKLGKIVKKQLELTPNQVFKLPSIISKALTRKNEIIYCINTREQSVDINDATGRVYLPLITKGEIKEKLSKVSADIRQKISMVHIGAIRILVKSQFAEGINSPFKMALVDDRINDRKDCILGAAQGNLAYGKFLFTVYPKFGLSLQNARLDRTLSLIHRFERKDLMNKGDHPFTITYLVGYALTNSHHSIDYKHKETIELEDIFSDLGQVNGKEFCKLPEMEQNWVMDITKGKKSIYDRTIPQRVVGNQLRIGEPTETQDIRPKINPNYLMLEMQKKTDNQEKSLVEISNSINDLKRHLSQMYSE